MSTSTYTVVTNDDKKVETLCPFKIMVVQNNMFNNINNIRHGIQYVQESQEFENLEGLSNTQRLSLIHI